MNRLHRLPIFALLLALLAGSAGTASSKAVIDIGPVMTAYEECVKGSDSGRAHLCQSAIRYIVGEFSWPAGGPDPRIEPAYVPGGVFVCSNTADTLVLGTVDARGNSVHLQLHSPSACAGGSEAGTRGYPLQADINPQYDPKIGPTNIAFDHGEEFRVGVCVHTVGNLAVFWRLPETDVTIVVIHFVPTECSAQA